MNDNISLTNFSKNLKALRKYSRLTKTQAAAELGIHRQTYTAYENGVSFPSFGATASIAEFFQVEATDIITKEPAALIAERELFDSLEEDEQSFLRSYRKLSPFSKGRLAEFTTCLYMHEKTDSFDSRGKK